MAHKHDDQPEGAAPETKFARLARALFGVKKADVEKHEPKKRPLPGSVTTNKLESE